MHCPFRRAKVHIICAAIHCYSQHQREQRSKTQEIINNVLQTLYEPDCWYVCTSRIRNNPRRNLIQPHKSRKNPESSVWEKGFLQENWKSLSEKRVGGWGCLCCLCIIPPLLPSISTHMIGAERAVCYREVNIDPSLSHPGGTDTISPSSASYTCAV